MKIHNLTESQKSSKVIEYLPNNFATAWAATVLAAVTSAKTFPSAAQGKKNEAEAQTQTQSSP
jgi:hypothetical protein